MRILVSLSDHAKVEIHIAIPKISDITLDQSAAHGIDILVASQRDKPSERGSNPWHRNGVVYWCGGVGLVIRRVA